jgi:ferredoxin
MSERSITVHVDHDVCIGNGMCRAAAPTAFAAAPNGQSVVANPDAESLERLLDAAATCPVGAIAVLDAETDQPVDLPQ